MCVHVYESGPAKLHCKAINIIQSWVYGSTQEPAGGLEESLKLHRKIASQLHENRYWCATDTICFAPQMWQAAGKCWCDWIAVHHQRIKAHSWLITSAERLRVTPLRPQLFNRQATCHCRGTSIPRVYCIQDNLDFLLAVQNGHQVWDSSLERVWTEALNWPRWPYWWIEAPGPWKHHLRRHQSGSAASLLRLVGAQARTRAEWTNESEPKNLTVANIKV